MLLRPHLSADERLATIGFDARSHDHTQLTLAEFPPHLGYRYVDHPHGRLPGLLAEGLLDAALWHRTTLAIPLSAVGINVRPLHRPEAIALARATGHAVLVARAAYREVMGVLTCVDLTGTRSLQRQIELDETLPLY